MKKINSITIAIIVVFTFSQFNILAQNKQEPQAVTSKKEVYTCPMHHNITSNKPGKCGKCGMNLESKNSDKKMDMKAKMGNPFFERTVNGLKFQVWIKTQDEHRKMMSENMAKKDHQMDKDMSDGNTMSIMMSGTHHIAVNIINEKTGKEVGKAVEIKTVSPTQKSASTKLIKRHSHFGSGISMDEKGTYHITVLKDKTQKVQFTYDVK